MAISTQDMTRLKTETQSEFRLIYMAAFLYFLTVALVSRMLPRSRRPHLAGQSGSMSIIAEARATARSVVPFAFMY